MSKEEEKKEIKIKNFDMKTLNIIKFPISKYESIYRVKYINKSPYQIYISLFLYEFIKYLSSNIININSNIINIGIICPYRAEANILDNLFNKINKNKEGDENYYEFNSNIHISIGTIHSFQGDECDMIFALFNTPKRIDNNVFINKQNILNVAISRARDYLFVIMPDDNTENINLSKIKEIENLIKQNNFKEYDTHNIEKLIFNNEKYLEENSFSTGHQEVNVYREEENNVIYEIKSDETAIDIQIK